MKLNVSEMSARITGETGMLDAKASSLEALAQICRSFGASDLAGESYTALADYYSRCVAPYVTSVKTTVLEKSALNGTYQAALGGLSLEQYDDEELTKLITEMTQHRTAVADSCADGALSPLCAAALLGFYDGMLNHLEGILEEFYSFENTVSGLYSSLDTYTEYLDQMSAVIDNVRAVFSPETAQGVSGEDIAQKAKSYIGLPYVWGAEDLNTAVDCSGFVRALFALYGFSFDGNANAFAMNTAATNGTTCTAVPLDQLQPGDIVARMSSGDHGHVGIYIGNGEYVNASGGSSNYDLAHAGKGVTISSIPTGGNVYAWRVNGLVEKKDPEELWKEMQEAVDSNTQELASNPLYVSSVYETAHPEETEYFTSLNTGLHGLPVEDRLGVKNALYGQAGNGESAFAGNPYKRIVAQSMGNGLCCSMSDSNETQVVSRLYPTADGGRLGYDVQISEADLAKARQDGYYEVFRAIGNGVDVSAPEQGAWSSGVYLDRTLSETVQADTASYIEAHAGYGSNPQGLMAMRQARSVFLSEVPQSSPWTWPGTVYQNEAVQDAYNNVVTAFRTDQDIPTAARAALTRATGGQLAGYGPVPGPGTASGLEGDQAYFADYFAEGVTGGAKQASRYTPKTSSYMYIALRNILQAYGG